MRFGIAFLALLGLAVAIPAIPKHHAADQSLLKKQQDVVYLLENILGSMPNQHLYQIGYNYEFEPNLHNYENPMVVKYYVGLVKTGHVQPKDTTFSLSVSALRKEVALLTQIFMGAKDYETFLYTAAWARVHVNVHQFVKAFASAVLQRQDMHGVILPPVYEIFPHYFFNSRIIEKIQNFVNQHGMFYDGQGDVAHHGGVKHFWVNESTGLPYGEHKIAYFTEDIGLGAYYAYVQMAGYMLPWGEHYGAHHQGQEGHHHIGHGSHYYYLHQQLLARYNLERLGQGLDPIRALDDYYEHIETPYNPHYRHPNGQAFPGRGEHEYITARHHNYELIKLVRALEHRIVEAIHSGHVITPQGTFLSLFQPNGIDILGELIEGTGHSVNPRYYGAFQQVAKQLLGNAPAFNNIYEYTPSALEVGFTAVRDPAFYQLYSKILEFFHYYQEALPAYQYNDVVVDGVKIENVDVSDLVTYFSDFEVDVSNAIPQPVSHQHKEHQPYPPVVAHVQRLDHKPYEYTIYVQAQKPVQGAVVRVFVGPKYNYDGVPVDINVHRHYFYELDQFYYNLHEGQNKIVRNSHQATGQSYDWPSIHKIKEHVESAMRSQNPYYVTYPQQLFGFPARLTLPKGTQNGFPLQFFFIISAGAHHQVQHYGPVVEEEWMTYQPHHYHIVDHEQYEQNSHYPVDKVHGTYQTVEVIPYFENHIITEGDWHWGYLYKKYPGSYYYPYWRYYNHRGSYQGGEYHGQYHGEQKHGKHQVEYQGEYHGEYHGEHQDEYHGEHKGEYHDVHHNEHGYEGKYIHKPVYSYQKYVEHPQGGKQWQTVYKQGSYYEQVPHDGQYHGSGHYPGHSDYHGTYPTGTYHGYESHEEYLQHYYENKYIGNIIGGAVSLDNMPLGWPFDRQMAHSAFYAPNIYIKDVVVYHHDEYHHDHHHER